MNDIFALMPPVISAKGSADKAFRLGAGDPLKNVEPPVLF
jgi:hypothetical protein